MQSSALTEPENDIRAQRRLQAFLNKYSSAICVVLDFDECVIERHISSELTRRYQYRIPSRPPNFGDCGFSGIANILDCYIGLRKDELYDTCRELALTTKWRPHALEMLQRMASSENHLPVFMSSGLDLAIDAMLQRVNLPLKYFACEMEYDDARTCICPAFIVTARLKGSLTLDLVQSGQFGRIYSVGHSYGDIPMLQAAEGITLRGIPGVEREAKYVIDGFDEVLELLGLA